MRGDRGAFERPAEDFAPYAGHVTPTVVMLNDGSLMATLRVNGVPFELEPNAVRNGRAERWNALLRQIGDDNVTVCSHLVRTVWPGEPPSGGGADTYGNRLLADYSQAALTGLFGITWLLTVIVHPRVPGASTVRRLFARTRTPRLRPHDAALRQLEGIVHTVTETLADYGVTRLGYRDEGEVRFSEIAEALYLIRTATFRPTPLVSGPLGASICTDRVVFGRRVFELQKPGVSRLGAILSFREYPPSTRPGMLNGLLSLRCAFVLSQSFTFRTRAQALGAIELQDRRLDTADEAAITQRESLEVAKDEVASGLVAFGQHHISLALYAPSMDELDRRTAEANAQMLGAGVLPVVEDRGLEAAWVAQLPGVSEWRTRPADISTRNLAHLASFESFPTGRPEGYWGAPPLRFRTRAATLYSYHPHVGGTGHHLVLGRSGAGKTVLLTLLAAALAKALARRKGTVIFFDKDRGAELLIRALGGRYLVLRNGLASGLAPLRGMLDSPEARAFLTGLCRGLIEQDGKRGIAPDEGRRLERAVARQMQLPVEMRSFGGIREFLGHSDPNGAGARFEKWCRGGEFGWLFDNNEDEIRIEADLLGFDLTALLPSSEALTDDGTARAAVAYIVHRLDGLMDGRPVAMICDECRSYMPSFGHILEDTALTGRKFNVALFLAAQEPSHFLSSPFGPSIISQARTRIAFPQADASREGYVDGLGFNEAEFRQLTGDMLIGGGRRFLLKRDSDAEGGGSVILEFDLSALPQHLAILSGRAPTVRLLDAVRAEFGDDPAVWLPEFYGRLARGDHQQPKEKRS